MKISGSEAANSYEIDYNAVKYGCRHSGGEQIWLAILTMENSSFIIMIDQLPAEQTTAALRYMHYLCADPVLLSLLNAPPDDEPYMQEQRERDAEAVASIAGGGGISHEEVLRECGL